MEQWQDIVLSIGSLFFIIGLMPSIFTDAKPAGLTSLTNALVLSAFTVAYATLYLWFAAVTTAITAGCWMVLAVQKARAKS